MASGLWAAQRRSLTIGLAATITFVAAEALAVVTVMPLVARDLHGLSLYGFVFSAFLLGTMVGIVAAGRAADKRGPAVPYIAGIVVFAAGLTVAGLAPTMPVLIAGRTLQGLGAGAVPAVAYVAIGRSLPEGLQGADDGRAVDGLGGARAGRPRAQRRGRQVLRLALGLPRAAALRRADRAGRDSGPGAARPRPAPAGEGQPHRLIDGIGVATCAGLVLGGLTLAVGSATGKAAGASAGHVSLPSVLAGAALTVAGLALGLPLLRRLLPPGRCGPGTGCPPRYSAAGC